MPRQARLDIPGALHHIILRGINKSTIFEDDREPEQFLRRLGENIADARAKVYAWALLMNHAHIWFKSGQQGISAVMRKQLTCMPSTTTVAMVAAVIFLKTVINPSSARTAITCWPSFATSISIPSVSAPQKR